MSQEKLVLEYASSQPAVVRFPTVVRVIVLLFILPALVLPFVEHLKSAPPLYHVVYFFRRPSYGDFFGVFPFMLCLNFFVGIPLVLCHLRLLIFGEFSRIERWGGYAVAFLGMACVATALSLFAVRAFQYYKDITTYKDIATEEMLLIAGIFILPVVVIAFGTIAVCFLGKRVSHGTRICACLCISYVAELLCYMAYDGYMTYSLSCLTFLTHHSPKKFWDYVTFRYALPWLVIVGCLIEVTTLAVMAFRRR